MSNNRSCEISQPRRKFIDVFQKIYVSNIALHVGTKLLPQKKVHLELFFYYEPQRQKPQSGLFGCPCWLKLYSLGPLALTTASGGLESNFVI